MTHPVRRTADILAGAAKSQEISERELSRLSGVPHSTLRAELAGTRAFRLDDFIATCGALGLTPAEVLAEAERGAA